MASRIAARGLGGGSLTSRRSIPINLSWASRGVSTAAEAEPAVKVRVAGSAVATPGDATAGRRPLGLFLGRSRRFLCPRRVDTVGSRSGLEQQDLLVGAV